MQKSKENYDHYPPPTLDGQTIAMAEGAGVAECEECGEEKNS